MAGKANAKAVETTPATQEIAVKFNSMRVYSNGDDIRYRAVLDRPIAGIRVNRETGEYEETNVDYIDFVPRVIIAQVIEQDSIVGTLFNKKKEQGLRGGNNAGFGVAELSMLLDGATVTIERVRHNAGDEYETSDGGIGVYEHVGYSTQIVDIKFTDDVNAMLKQFRNKLLFGDL